VNDEVMGAAPNPAGLWGAAVTWRCRSSNERQEKSARLRQEMPGLAQEIPGENLGISTVWLMA
jgi:hypothetical protein